ncbi:hypothetical protein [Bradyrhizobium sp. ERR14]|uniref:hypothetical protein n=1 Tax=Bradyrhizobium sp. ERR14 TaxID=2663837 RepID=UPI00160D8C75|nr:hypothetical protein [Bradyrhizobium sp. ERR14]MBB4397947.1 hypothetical protein [Bradyrhizobium sp. ERR14]
MRAKKLALMLPTLLLAACQETGTNERLQAAADVVGAEYRLSSEIMQATFEKHDVNTLVVASTRGPAKRYELQEPEHCQFRFTVDAGTRNAQTTTADLGKLNRLEVPPTMSGNSGIVYLAGSEANTVEVRSRYGNNKSNKVRLNNLQPAQIDAFLSKVAEFQDKFCGVKVQLPG